MSVPASILQGAPSPPPSQTLLLSSHGFPGSPVMPAASGPRVPHLGADAGCPQLLFWGNTWTPQLSFGREFLVICKCSLLSPASPFSSVWEPVLGSRPQPHVVTASLKWVGLVPTGMPSLCKIYTRFPRLRAKKGGKLARYMFLIFIMMK